MDEIIRNVFCLEYSICSFDLVNSSIVCVEWGKYCRILKYANNNVITHAGEDHNDDPHSYNIDNGNAWRDYNNKKYDENPIIIMIMIIIVTIIIIYYHFYGWQKLMVINTNMIISISSIIH